KVIRVGSALRLRISFAARPTDTRSRDSSSVSASSSEMRSPSTAFARISAVTSHFRDGGWHQNRPFRSRHHRLSNEPELGHLVEPAGAARQLEEGHRARPPARPEAVAQLLEVAREEPGRIAVALARLVCELLGLGAREPHRRDESILELRK